MHCTFCDGPLPAGARYCPTCGTATPTPPMDDAYSKSGPGPYVSPRDYGPSAWPAATATSPLALISLLAGLSGISVLFGIGSVIAVVTGHLALREIRASGGRIGGEGMAFTGLALGYVVVVPALVILAFGILALVIAAGSVGGHWIVVH